VLGRLPVIKPDPKSVYGGDPEEARKSYTEDAIRILTSIRAMDRRDEVASDKTLGDLIEGLYARPDIDRAEWRQL
jgi:hypothetical protein